MSKCACKGVWMMVAAAGLTGLFAVAGAGLMGAGEATPAAAPAATADGAFAVDAVHSSVFFKIKHMNVANFYGRFNKVSGSFLLNKESPESSSLELTIDTTSVDSNNKGRDDHLKGNDFFAVKEFPTSTFKSTAVKKTGEGVYEVTGDLTLRGTTKPVTAIVTDTGSAAGRKGGTVAGMEAVVTIKRSEFGVSFMSGAGLSEEVTLTVSLEGKKD